MKASRLRLRNPLTSPGNDPTPEIVVFGVEPLAKVQIFRDFCSKSVSRQVSVLENESTVNIIVDPITSEGTNYYRARQTDQAGNKSTCSSASLDYKYDKTIPNAPSGLSLHDPLISPGNDPTPEIQVLKVESLAKVQLFSDSTCSTSVSPQVSVLKNESTVNIIANPVAPEGTLTYYAHQIDQAGNISDCSSSSLIYQYTLSPTIKKISIEYGNYLVGESITVSVEFVTNVTVDTRNGVPRLTLLVGSSTQYATYHLGSGSSILTFIYTVGQQEIDKDGISITSPIDLQGGSIQSTSFEDVHLTFTPPQVFPRVFVNAPEMHLGTTGLDCSNVVPAPEGYSNSRDSIAYQVSSTSFYIVDVSGLTKETQQFEFCLSPDSRITAELNQSYITESNSLVWGGQVLDTPASLAHQVANSIIFLKRNNEIRGTVWANGYPYRIWPLDGGLYRIEEITGSRSILDEPHITDSPILEEINIGESIPEISVMTVFTFKANEKVRDIYALSELAIAEANFGYRASGVKARLKLVHAVAHSYIEVSGSRKALSRIINPNDGYMDDVHVLRDQYEADIGILITSSGSASVENILESPERAFAFVNYEVATGIYSFTHEIGHLLGAQHEASLTNMGSNVPYAFGHGYADPKVSSNGSTLSAWRTVMAYGDNCLGCFRINIWSNPNITILGEPAGNAVFSDNVRVLNMNASAFASFRGETYADLSGEGIALQNGSVVTNIGENRGESVLYAIEVPTGATNLRIETSGGTGDVNLYIKAKVMVVPGFYDCVSKKISNNDEMCVFEHPEAGRYHVLLYGYNDFSDVTLEVQYDEPGN